MSEPIHINDDEFEEKVLQSGLPVIVDFWAPWCGPCRMITPVLEEIAQDYAGRLLVAKINTDENPEWMMHYGIMGIPTLLFVSGGQVIDQQVGAIPQPALKSKAAALLAHTGSVLA